MIPLSKEIKKLGEYPFTLTQEKRTEDFALYCREEQYGSRAKSWEVVKITKRTEPYKIGSYEYPPGELYPGASQWGLCGWTHNKRKDAEERFNRLTSARF